MSEKRVIEFCGLPGTGKSTIARALLQSGFTRVRIVSRVELFTRNLRYLVKHPYAFFKMLFIILKVGLTYGRLYPLFMNVFLDVNARIEKAYREAGNAIIDQGHLQALLSLSYHEITTEEVRAFLCGLPEGHQIVFLTIDEQTREERLSVRGYRPRTGDTHEVLWNMHLRKNFETLMSTLQGGENVVTLDTRGAVSDVVRALQTHISL